MIFSITGTSAQTFGCAWWFSKSTWLLILGRQFIFFLFRLQRTRTKAIWNNFNFFTQRSLARLLSGLLFDFRNRCAGVDGCKKGESAGKNPFLILIFLLPQSRRMFRHHFQATEMSRAFYDILTCLASRVYLAYITFPFVILELGVSSSFDLSRFKV